MLQHHVGEIIVLSCPNPFYNYLQKDNAIENWPHQQSQGLHLLQEEKQSKGEDRGWYVWALLSGLQERVLDKALQVLRYKLMAAVSNIVVQH